MKKEANHPYIVNSILALHRLLKLPYPEHPLVSVINLDEIECFADESLKSVINNFYLICIKKKFEGKLKYGQNYCDFDKGVVTFFSPGQVISTDITPGVSLSGWWLVIHPDFIRNYQLAKTIKDYGYFSYEVNEALHLSEKEETMITSIMKNVEQEYRSVIDNFSQDVMILILNYC